MIKWLDKTVLKWFVNFLWTEYYRPVENYQPNWKILRKYFFFQKILRINGRVKWPVHFTSLVMGADRIKKGVMCDPGDSPNCYIQAFQGINFGSNVEIAPGCRLISSNHDLEDFSKAMPSKGPFLHTKQKKLSQKGHGLNYLQMDTLYGILRKRYPVTCLVLT